MSEIRFTIPSHNRADMIGSHTLKFFPEAIVCVAESQRDDYRKVSNNLLLHPDTLKGIGPKRQWMLDNIDSEVVVMIDDDMKNFISIVGMKYRSYRDPADVKAIVARTALCAAEAGASLFGFHQTADVRKFIPHKPFNLCTWFGGAIGFIGRKFKYDSFLRSRGEDVDYSLQTLLKDRFVWGDNRYGFIFRRWDTKGGNSANRERGQQLEEIRYLKRKWGKFLEVQQRETCERLIIRVTR